LWHSGSGTAQCTGGSNFKIDQEINKIIKMILAEIEEQFEVNLFQGLVQVLAVKQKKRRSEDMKKRIQAASQKRIVRSPPIFGLSLPLTACPGMRSKLIFGLSEFSCLRFVNFN